MLLLGGVDESTVRPIAERLDSPVFSATFAFYRSVPHYMAGDYATAVELAGHAVALARTAGALTGLAGILMGFGGWQATLPDASLDDVFGPQAESLDLWDRLRIPWGLVAVAEEIAQSLAIRGYHEGAFVLWGAVDSTGIQAPSKVGRGRRADPYIEDVPADQAAAWRARGEAMTLDQTVAFAASRTRRRSRSLTPRDTPALAGFDRPQQWVPTGSGNDPLHESPDMQVVRLAQSPHPLGHGSRHVQALRRAVWQGRTLRPVQPGRSHDRPDLTSLLRFGPTSESSTRLYRSRRGCGPATCPTSRRWYGRRCDHDRRWNRRRP